MNITCNICKRQTNYTIKSFAKYHLKKEHNLTSKQYYDLTIKKENEGLCKICQKETHFGGIEKGYSKYCSNKCVMSDPEQLAINFKRCKEEQYKKYNGKMFFETEEGQKKVQKIITSKYGTKSCFGNVDIQKKIRDTNLQKYGLDNPFKDKKIQRLALQNKFAKYGNGCNKEKHKQTCLERYGVDNYNKTIDFRHHMEQIGRWSPLETLNEYEKYRRVVNKETRKYRKKIFKEWNGLCFYTGQKLITTEEWYRLNPNIHVSHNKLQPTIDHKIPVIYGFKNNIPAEQIGSFNNLCICARIENTRKGHKIKEN